VRVRVGDADCASGLAPRRAGHRLTCGLVGRHADRREERLALVRSRKADEGRVHAGQGSRPLECQREDGVEVDRGADLSELKCALRLGARFLEGACEVAVQPLSARERFTQELLDGGVGASPSAHDHEQGDDGRDEGELAAPMATPTATHVALSLRSTCIPPRSVYCAARAQVTIIP
jgi:hypothetical protein